MTTVNPVWARVHTVADDGTTTFGDDVVVTDGSVSVHGLPGATTATRLVGGTASGAPVSGTFQANDVVFDRTGKVWLCTVAGTPGTWVQIGSGGGGASGLTQLDQVTVAVAAGTITLTPSGAYNNLMVSLSAKGTAVQDNTYLKMTFNGDAGTNYNEVLAQANGTTWFHSYDVLQNYIFVGDMPCAGSVAGNVDAGASSQHTIDIVNYRSTAFNKTVHIRAGQQLKAAGSTASTLVNSAFWKSLAAITSIRLAPGVGNFAVSTVATLYGY